VYSELTALALLRGGGAALLSVPVVHEDVKGGGALSACSERDRSGRAGADNASGTLAQPNVIALLKAHAPSPA
jgi:hypothetical protein